MPSLGSRASWIAAAWTCFASPAAAQPNLPPPPPPPLEGRTPIEPSVPSPHRATQAPAPVPVPPTPVVSAPPPRHAAPPPPPPARVVHVRARPESSPDEPERRATVISWSPVPLAWGRLALEGELRVAGHHALFGGLSALVYQADRGGSGTMLSAGFGFASASSSGLGMEIGYHYWVDPRRDLAGAFLGPSLMLGTTTQATAGASTGWQGYFGWRARRRLARGVARRPDGSRGRRSRGRSHGRHHDGVSAAGRPPRLGLLKAEKHRPSPLHRCRNLRRAASSPGGSGRQRSSIRARFEICFYPSATTCRAARSRSSTTR